MKMIITEACYFAAMLKKQQIGIGPAVEKVLVNLYIAFDRFGKYRRPFPVTKDEDIKNFNNLDVIGTEGSKAIYYLILKGREGWNCRSPLGIALFRSPKSKVFVLQLYNALLETAFMYEQLKFYNFSCQKRITTRSI